MNKILNKWLLYSLLLMILIVAVYKIALPFTPFWVDGIMIGIAILLIVISKILPNENEDYKSKTDEAA